jgi:hypothetical protein
MNINRNNLTTFTILLMLFWLFGCNQMSSSERLINAQKAFNAQDLNSAKKEINRIEKGSEEYLAARDLLHKIENLEKEKIEQIKRKLQAEADNRKAEADNRKKIKHEKALLTDQSVLLKIGQRHNDLRKQMKNYYVTKEDLNVLQTDIIRLESLKFIYNDSKSPTENRLFRQASILQKKLRDTLKPAFASVMEEIFVKSGIDVKVVSIGNTLRVEYVLMSWPLVYQFQNESKLGSLAKVNGFSKIIYTDGFESSLGETWTVKL